MLQSEYRALSCKVNELLTFLLAELTVLLGIVTSIVTVIKVIVTSNTRLRVERSR